MKSFNLTVRAAQRPELIRHLSEVGLPYTEQRHLFGKSTITVTLHTEAHEDAYWQLAMRFSGDVMKKRVAYLEEEERKAKQTPLSRRILAFLKVR